MRTIPNTSLTDIAMRFLISAHDLMSREAAIDSLYTLELEKVVAEDLGHPLGLAPVFVWQADCIHERVTGFPFGFGYRKEPGSLTGYQINLDTCTEASAEILLYLVEALSESRTLLPQDGVNPGAVALDQLVGTFQEAMRERFAPATTNERGPVGLQKAQG